ncbi:MAG TPA: hypothetical protein EYP71_07285 [Dehalococcoidia bacterium]|nr:hypothetical protein [Dehalococcoidia bacterium]
MYNCASNEKEGLAMKLPCESCKLRRYGEGKPDSLIAKIWRWHTGWCPGWKAYQRKLTREGKSA